MIIKNIVKVVERWVHRSRPQGYCEQLTGYALDCIIAMRNNFCSMSLRILLPVRKSKKVRSYWL